MIFPTFLPTEFIHVTLLAPACFHLKIPNNAYLKEKSISSHYIGQEVTIECKEGFEFTDPEKYTYKEKEASLGENIFSSICYL